jgi:hypothetical protein
MMKAFNQIKLNRNYATFGFNSKAGCSCGCSPGFINNRQGDLAPITVFVDVTVTP